MHYTLLLINFSSKDLTVVELKTTKTDAFSNKRLGRPRAVSRTITESIRYVQQTLSQDLPEIKNKCPLVGSV